jgi:regulator of protease activity HflC (stomatin/prohibitin superfamily)
MAGVDWGATALLLIVILGSVLALWVWMYWVPRTRAFKNGLKRVSIYLGLGELILWNPGETFAFLRNKRLESVGDQNGGWKSIFPLVGSEAVGPIPLQLALYNWEDQKVLTRDGQPLAIRAGVWWQVDDAARFVFHIYSDKALGNEVANNRAKLNPVLIHEIADSWLKVTAESTIRAKINSMAVADVVSSQAMQFLRYQDSAAGEDKAITSSFEAAILSVQDQIQEKCQTFGIRVNRLEVQRVQLPADIQKAINETRIAFLSPIRSEREAEATKVRLEKLGPVLGMDTVALNELLKNFQHANFMTPMSFLQPLFERVENKSSAVAQQSMRPPQLPQE